MNSEIAVKVGGEFHDLQTVSQIRDFHDYLGQYIAWLECAPKHPFFENTDVSEPISAPLSAEPPIETPGAPSAPAGAAFAETKVCSVCGANFPRPKNLAASQWLIRKTCGKTECVSAARSKQPPKKTEPVPSPTVSLPLQPQPLRPVLPSVPTPCHDEEAARTYIQSCVFTHHPIQPDVLRPVLSEFDDFALRRFIAAEKDKAVAPAKAILTDAVRAEVVRIALKEKQSPVPYLCTALGIDRDSAMALRDDILLAHEKTHIERLAR